MKKIIMVLAAALLLSTACSSDYDDTALKGRLDDLEERVDTAETTLAALQRSVKNINQEYALLQALVNGSFITSVDDSVDGQLTITVTDADNKTTTYTVKNGTDGVNGVDGNNGTNGTDGLDGHRPNFTIEKDEDGRYVWYLDGELYEEDGAPVYADGYGDAATGEKGKTPTFWLGYEKDGKPDFEGTEGEMSWFVSFNEELLDEGEYATAKWTKVNIFSGNDEGDEEDSTITVKFENGVLTVSQGSNTYGPFDLMPNKLSVVYEMEDEFDQPIEEFGVVRFYDGEKKTIKLDITGGSENTFVKAKLYDNDGGYSIKVTDSEIEVEALGLGAYDKLLIYVLDGTNVYNTWVDLSTDIPTITVTPDVTGTIDLFSHDDTDTDGWDEEETAHGTNYKFTFFFHNDLHKTSEATASIAVSGEGAAYFDVLERDAEFYKNINWESTRESDADYVYVGYIIDKLNMPAGIHSATFTTTVTSDDYYHLEGAEYTLSVFSKAEPVELSAANVSFPLHYDGQIEYLVDGDLDANSFAGSYYGVGDFAGGNYTDYQGIYSVWGVWIDLKDIYIPENAKYIVVKYTTRHNCQPKTVGIGVSEDGESDWKEIAEFSEGLDTGTGATNVLLVERPTDMEIISGVRIGVKVAASGDLRTNPLGSTGFREIELLTI